MWWGVVKGNMERRLGALQGIMLRLFARYQEHLTQGRSAHAVVEGMIGEGADCKPQSL